MTKKIELKKIDTSEAAKNFAKLLEKNKTYFLNGSWGSGKTTFLKEVEKYLGIENKSFFSKIKQKILKKKFIHLDLWKMNEDISIMEFAYSKVQPIGHILINLGLILFTGTAALATTIFGRMVINMSNGDPILGNILTIKVNNLWDVFPYVLSVIFLLGSFQYYKNRSSLIYYYLLNKFLCTNNILVIDDFDRIPEERQKDAYKLFSHLKGKLPIIFVGDIILVTKGLDNNFLSKIIDRRVELPYDLHPNSIWTEYFQEFERVYNIEISDSFKKRIVTDRRNLRDREHFNDYVHREFILNGKLGTVQVDQQLLVIYCFLFEVEDYYRLLNMEDIIVGEVMKRNIELEMIKGTPIKLLLKELQKQDNGRYPDSFNKNSRSYYMFEAPSNSSIQELDSIFNSKDTLKKEIVISGSYSDFYKYISSEYYKFDIKRKDLLVELVLELAFDKKLVREECINLDLMKYILTKKTEELILDKQGNRVELSYIEWINFLEERGLDISEKLEFLYKYSIVNIRDLGINYFRNLEFDIKLFKELRRKDSYLIVYLSSRNIIQNFDIWENKVWEWILMLDDMEFISFWIQQRILYNGQPNYAYYDYIPKDKEYSVVEKRKEWLSEEIVSYENILEKIEPRLELLKTKGYNFEYIEDIN